jgi:transposase
MEKRITIKVSSPFSPGRCKEEKMIESVHGIDRHKNFSTISVLNREGQEVKFYSACLDLKSYVDQLGPGDAVILEASTGTFWWADQIEAHGAACYILDPHKFKIIKDSWNKTDKHDARNMAKALWVYLITGEFGIPTVYKPQAAVRELRRLFTQQALLNRQICMHKNNIQAILADNGVSLRMLDKERLLQAEKGPTVLKSLDISASSRISIKMSQELLWKLQEQKELLGREIILAGESFQN